MTALRRFSVLGLRFVRRPVWAPPPDGTACIVDNGDEHGWSDDAVGMFKDGQWTKTNSKPLPFTPTFWIEQVNE